LGFHLSQPEDVPESFAARADIHFNKPGQHALHVIGHFSSGGVVSVLSEGFVLLEGFV
jgi:hypothetical protein